MLDAPKLAKRLAAALVVVVAALVLVGSADAKLRSFALDHWPLLHSLITIW